MSEIKKLNVQIMSVNWLQMTNYDNWVNVYEKHLQNLYNMIPEPDSLRDSDNSDDKLLYSILYPQKKKIEFKDFIFYVYNNSSGYISQWT